MAVEGFSLHTQTESSKKTKQRSPSAKDTPTAACLFASNTEKHLKCIFCEREHASAECNTARKMPYEERQKVIRDKNACFGCLRLGHSRSKCRVHLKCAWCGKRHVTLMCPVINHAPTTRPVQVPPCPQSNVNSALTSFSSNAQVLLQTVRVRIHNGKTVRYVRAIIDTGSQRSYILKQVARDMDYVADAEQLISHALFGGAKEEPSIHRRFKIYLSNQHGSYSCNFNAIEKDIICNNVPCTGTGSWTKELENLNVQISDTTMGPIELLIGADVAGKLLTGCIHNLSCGLVAVETRLGWTVMGKSPKIEVRDDMSLMVTSLFIQDNSIDDLWKLDVLGIRDPVEVKLKKQRDSEIHQSLINSVKINSDERYEVSLPWIENHPVLPDNREIAKRRLESVHRKLKTDGMLADYDQIFDDWKAEGIIEEVPKEEQHASAGHYLPHRHVVKEDSTTRIRPVFDASAKQKDMPSLNQCLEKGPNLIELINTILLKFRKDSIGVISDIKKAFLQISIDKPDRDFLRFLWFDKNGKIITFRHCRVVFGVTSSPFILGAIIDLHLRNLIDNCSSSDNERANLLKLSESFYVDNCVASVSDKTHLNEFITDAKTAMDSGGFDLRGWHFSHDSSSENPVSVLGVQWDKIDDTLMLSAPSLDILCTEKVTKRIILSLVHRIFDPLGIACPILICPKILLQETWAKNISWDEEVTDEIRDRFLAWTRDLHLLNEIKVPRCIIGNIDKQAKISLHIFCDASKVAYSTIIFLRTEESNNIRVNFVVAKSRVAPLKDVTIPRLELMAACIAARLASSTIDILKLNNCDVYFWSDSSTVLAWIKRNRQWSTFIWNRVQEIRKLTDSDHWHYVPGALNPADLPSRGCSASHLVESHWWEGPAWLNAPPHNWPSQSVLFDENEIKIEIRKSAKVDVQTELLVKTDICEQKESLWYERFSNFNRLLLVIGWIKRFKTNCLLKKESRIHGDLSATEISKAETALIKLVQKESFENNDKRLKLLQTVRDSDDVIRVKTKIVMREDNMNFRYPVVVPASHYLVKLLIKQKHWYLSHAGLQILINNLREEFWILNARRMIKAVIKECIICRRYEAKGIQAIPAPLPVDRVKDAKVFEIVGIDFAGPIFLKNEQKAWICLFTCAVYRAVHLELVSSLSTLAFLEALRRFISRRGRPSIVWCDNATNFVGLDNLLKKIDWQRISRFAALEKIRWKFIPPSAPWWGGWWERLIGLMKKLLRRNLRTACLTYEEMSTILCDCEAIINSRPITFISDDSHEFAPLTPSMFLQEIEEIGVTDLDLAEKFDLGKRFLQRQKLRNDLRFRFRKEYLGTLVGYNKRKMNNIRNIKIGDVVLVEYDNLKRLEWPLALVKDLIVGKGNQVRAVRLTTANGNLFRPIQRIIPLELSYDDSSTKVTVSENMASVVRKAKETSASKPAKDLNLNESQAIVTRVGRLVKRPEKLTM